MVYFDKRGVSFLGVYIQVMVNCVLLRRYNKRVLLYWLHTKQLDYYKINIPQIVIKKPK